MSKKRLLFLPKYGPLAASCRYRFLQYLPYLEEAGFRCTVSPLLDDDYLREKFEKGSAPKVALLRAAKRRTQAVLSASAHDLVILAYEAFPFLPPLAERLLSMRRVRYIYDYDDAIFHMYDQRPVLRTVLGNKIRTILAGAELVLAGSEYLAQYARSENPQVEHLPTVIDLTRYPERQPPKPSARHPERPFTIGWIGSPSTAAYLPAIEEALRLFCRETSARVVLIGSGPLTLQGVPLQIRPWSEEREVADLMECDVGIMPLPDTPWARGKCGFKLIQYMACSLPVIASPVGANCDIVKDGQNGLFARDTGDWLAALRRFQGDPAFRHRLGQKGRSLVESHYCLQVTAPRLVSLLQKATCDTPARA